MTRSMRRRARRLRYVLFGLYRPQTVAVLIAAVCLAFALNVHLFRRYRKTPMDVVRGVWRYGPVGLFVDPPIPPVRLSDPATFHLSCGPECSMRAR